MNETKVPEGHLTWPVPVLIHDGDGPMVRLSGLSSDRKQRAWAEIKASSPGLSQLLRDPMIQEIMSTFSAELYIDAEHAPSLPPQKPLGRTFPRA